ncbi:MAG: hypothetical protein OIN66_15785 [Candidatus Methanoperedens sp.]|nr:hypothetical protein [Candidatus Methanoperedens sp.]
MEKKITVVIGILVLLLSFGAISVAMAQNTGDEKTKDAENHECTAEMMENMSENCPEQMIQSGACENAMNGAKGCSEMMGNNGQTENTETDTKSEGTDHCGDMDDMGSMMGSSLAIEKDML